MKLNSGGLKLSAAYILYAAVVITLAYFTDDPKGRFVLGSLAWAPAGVTFEICTCFQSCIVTLGRTHRTFFSLHAS